MKKIIFLFVLFCVSPAFADVSVSLNSLKELRNTSSIDKVEGNLLVYFWASWCPDCREKLNGPLGKLQEEFPKARIITVNSDRDENKGIQFVASEKIILPVYRDKEKELSRSLKLFAVPSWAVLKRDKENQWRVLMSSNGSDLTVIKQQLAR